MNGNDDSCGQSSEVSWESSFGTEYFIFLHGYQGAVGDFELSLTFEAACSTAESVEVGDTILGSTVGTQVHFGMPCTISGTASAGVWFRIAGTGREIAISTCGVGTNFNTRVGVGRVVSNLLLHRIVPGSHFTP